MVKNKKRAVRIGALLLLTLTLSACGNNSEEENTTNQTGGTSQSEIRIQGQGGFRQTSGSAPQTRVVSVDGNQSQSIQIIEEEAE